MCRSIVLNAFHIYHISNGSILTTYIAGETQGAFFNRKCYSIHTGYKYSKTEPFGFAAVSSYTDHKVLLDLAFLKGF